MKKITKKQEKRIKKAVAYLQNYMNTYTDQNEYQRMFDHTFIDDVLYGLGASLGKEYEFRDGFDRFKDVLRKHLRPTGDHDE